ncbi:MAG: N-acetylmuramoyl-L-alanine amidase [Thermaerobacter sp.]|nr:N-acetylmuramoyl-L-alanine amidase [Thermaerobacter sp.]
MRNFWRAMAAVGLALAALGVGARVWSAGGGAPRAVAPYVGMLAGRTIVIDPGHGGWDPGAVNRRAREADINLAVAEMLRGLLEDAGARVLLTWSAAHPIPAHRKYRVQARSLWINRQQADVLIDIHTNIGSGGVGPQVFYWDGIASRVLADAIQEELSGFTGTHRRVTRINQYVLRYSAIPAVNVEVGFLSHAQEALRLTTAQYQRDLAWCIFVGLLRWFVGGSAPPEYLAPPRPAELLR